jgi:hypothetical protein
LETQSIKYSEFGYCSVDKQDVSIEIEYISLPKIYPGDNQQFIKNNNYCSYLREGKCNKGKNCNIYKNAPKTLEVNPYGILKELEN